MTETRTLKGGCHCGAVRYTAQADLAQVIDCNCSHCAAKGMVLTFTPASQFTLEQGEDALSDYLFNRRAIRHRFCRTCGVESFAESAMPDGTPIRAINLRCVEGVDVKALNPTPFDGASV